MKRLSAFLSASLLALTVAGCGPSANEAHDADIRAIKTFETQWNQDYVAKDADRIVNRYTDDAVLMGPAMEAAFGRSAILKVIKQMTSDPAMSLKFQPGKIEVAQAGDIAYTQGSYTLTVTDPQTKKVVNDHGSYVTTYRKQADGKWKAVVDIATSEVVPAAPAPSPAPAPDRGRAKGKGRRH